MTRSVLVGVTLAGLLAAVRPARAETGMLPNAATISFNKVFITENGAFVEPTNPDTLRRYLNFAHCRCSQQAAGTEQTIRYELGLSLNTGTNAPGELWVGTQCDGDDTQRSATCRQLAGGIADIDTLAISPKNVDVSLYDVINGKENTEPCLEVTGSRFLWMLVDHDTDSTYDYFTSKAIGTTAEVNGIDTQAPPLPTNFEASSAENAIEISWALPEARPEDIYYYQALCAGPDGLPVTTSPAPARYQTVRDLCGLPEVPLLSQTDIPVEVAPDAGAGAPDAPDAPVMLPDELRQLDPRYICGDSAEATATGLRVSGLSNDVPYIVVLLAIDYYGNATGTYFTRTITPRPSTDFWEDLHDRGSEVEGGFCLIAETYGDDNPLTRTLRAFRDDTLAHSAFGRWVIDTYYATLATLGADVHGSSALRVIAAVILAPLVVIALVWHVISLPGLLALIGIGWAWRRRRHLLRSRLVRATATAAWAALVLAPGHARAQSTQPYWETDPTGTESQPFDDVQLVRWHVGIRVGPYTPDIDRQLGADPGPYEAMYGGYQVLPMLDIDRILWRGFGQLGVGGTIGYMQKSGHSFKEPSSPTDDDRPRSEGDLNTFHLIPLAATATYRFTWFDDAYGVPIVPYLRGGLAYYTWWVTANDKIASTCTDGGMDPGCATSRARGASLGLQGSIGIAVRAERIDASAAQSMRQGGIEHAGFYAELSMAKVDGFGAATKLAVGDRTWFAGVDFEF